MAKLELKSQPCLKSHMMPSANRPQLLRVHLKVTLAKPLPSNSLVLSRLPPANSRRITRRTHNSVMLTTATTNSSMLNKEDRVNRMALHPSNNVLTADITAIKPLHPNSRKTPLSSLSHVTALVRVRTAVTLLPTLPTRANNKQAKEPSLSQAIHNNHKLEIIHTVILTTPAPITQHM